MAGAGFDVNAVFGAGDTGLNIRVDIAPGAILTADPDTWPWLDVTAYTLGRARVVITRGRRDEQGQVGPSQATLEVRNPNGEWVEDNPYGPWWPNLIVGTPLRVRVVIGGTSYTRFSGFIFELPPRYEEGLTDTFVPITANGVLLRLGQGSVPVAAVATAAAAANPDLVAYWPCTDAAGSSKAVATTGGKDLTATPAVDFAAEVGPDGKIHLPGLSDGGRLFGPVPGAPGWVNTSGWAVQASVKVDVTSGFVYPLAWDVGGGGTTNWSIEYKNDSTTNVLWMDNAGNVNAAVSVGTSLRDGLWHQLSVHAAQSGADIAVTFYIDGVSAGTGSVVSKTLAFVSRVSAGEGSPSSSGRSVGQIGLYKSSAQLSAAAAVAATGGAGETTLARFYRLCAGQQVAYETSPGDTFMVMGAQSDVDFLGQLRECTEAEVGVLVETREGRLRLDPRSVRANAAPVLTVDILNGLADIQPTNDVRLRTNDFTANRTGGGSGHFADAAHIAKYGLYDKSGTFNVAYDGQLVDQASVRVGMGTVAGLRHPMIHVNLRAHPELVPAVLACDISSRLVGVNPPVGMKPVDVIAEGYTEELDALSWDVTYSTSPFQPYNIIIVANESGDLDPHLGHADWDTCVLAEDLDTTETGVDVTTTPLITVDPDDFPWKITVDGEDMTVTACAGAGNPQTLTVTRSTNGIVRTHLTGAVVELHPESACYLSL